VSCNAGGTQLVGNVDWLAGWRSWLTRRFILNRIADSGLALRHERPQLGSSGRPRLVVGWWVGARRVRSNAGCMKMVGCSRSAGEAALAARAAGVCVDCVCMCVCVCVCWFGLLGWFG